MNKRFSSTIIMYGIVFFTLVTGCVASGPLIKPNQGSRKEYVYSHPALNEEIRQAILAGKIVKGMTKGDVKATWGDPTNILNLEYPRYYKKDEEGWYYKGTLLQTLAPNCTITFFKGIVEKIYCGGPLEK